MIEGVQAPHAPQEGPCTVTLPRSHTAAVTTTVPSAAVTLHPWASAGDAEQEETQQHLTKGQESAANPGTTVGSRRGSSVPSDAEGPQTWPSACPQEEWR